jgi:hypothetical protein
MSKFLEQSNEFNSSIFLVLPLLKNVIGLNCKLKALKKKNYKLYDNNGIIWYNLTNNDKLNGIIGGSKGIKIHYFWLSDEKIKDKTILSFILNSHGIGFDQTIKDFNEKFKIDYKRNEVVMIMLYFSKKFIWDEEKITSFLEELEEDYFSIQDQQPPCSDCRYRFFKNLVRKCDYLYVEAKLPM